MTEGTIVKWCKAEGDKIGAGDVLCEVQTDKAVVAMEVDDDAILAKILVPEGQAGIAVNTLIALSVEEGEDWKDVQIPAVEDEDEAEPDAAAATDSAVATPTSGLEVAEHHIVHVPKAGPSVMLLCALYGIDPSQVKATGPKGLLKSDLLQHISDNKLTPLKLSAPSVKQEADAAAPPSSRPRAGYTDVPLTSMRSVIAKRLSQSKNTSPHGYATAECNIDALNAIRKDFKESAGIKVSVNDLIIKAAATALQLVPEVNLNTVGEADYEIMPNIDISVAVATPQGLITPIVKNVVGLSLPDISSNVRDLALRARDGKLQLHEFQVSAYVFVIFVTHCLIQAILYVCLGRYFYDLQPWDVRHQGVHCHHQPAPVRHHGRRLWSCRNRPVFWQTLHSHASDIVV